MMLRIGIGCLALLTLGTAWAQELTLDQAVALALKNNRQITNSRLELEKSGLEIDVAKTNRLPSFRLNVFEGQFLAPVSFTFPAGAWGVYPATGPIPATSTKITSPMHPFTLVNASVTQPLTQLPRIRLGIRMRETERDIAREKLDAAQQAAVNDVRKLYYQILQTQSAVTASESSVASLRELDRVESESAVRKMILQSELLDVKARLAKADYESATQQLELAASKERLNDLMGRDARTEFSVQAVPQPSEVVADLEQIRAQALAGRPEIREARLQVHEARQDRQLKHQEFMPAVDFTLQYLSPFQLILVPQNIAAAGVQLNWDVYDWGKKKRELAVKDVIIKQAENNLAMTESQVLMEVESRYRKLEQSRRMLRVAEMAQTAARERLRVVKDRYAGEGALSKDLLEAQAALAETEAQQQEALSSYLTAQADLDRASGSK